MRARFPSRIEDSVTRAVLNTVWFQLSQRDFFPPCLQASVKFTRLTVESIHSLGIYTHRLQDASSCPRFSLLPSCRNVGAPGLPERSAGLTANTAQCHGVHWLSYLPIYHSWIGTSLAWNLLSDFVRVTWDAWCCNCSAFGNGGSIANVFRVILTYLVCFIL